ncbi:MAG: hypothetical protein ACPIOQ_69260 [Promethearchaeia archaeon]
MYCTGSLDPEPKGFLQRVKGGLVKGAGAVLLMFVTYHVAVGALRAVVFWLVTPVLGAAAFFAWRFFKSGNKKT